MHPNPADSFPNYVLSALATVIIVPTVNIAFISNQEMLTFANFFNALSLIPYAFLFVLILGWILWVPILLIAFLFGFPIFQAGYLIMTPCNRYRLKLLFASLLSSIATVLLSDVLLFILVKQNHPLMFPMFTQFGLTAIVTAAIATQIIYRQNR